MRGVSQLEFYQWAIDQLPNQLSSWRANQFDCTVNGNFAQVPAVITHENFGELMWVCTVNSDC
jgi:hypothetical protein